MARRILAALAGLSGAAVAMASGCGALDGYDCAELLACDVINEDGTSNAACEGTCVDVDVSGFEDEPRIVWIGPASEQPSCGEALLDEPRSDAGVTMIEYERLVAEPGHVGCGPCACTEPACVLPAGLTVTSGWMCGNSPGETVTPFRAPRGWDGACVAPGAVAPEAFGSFDVAPVTERPCEVALAPAPRNGDLPGGQIAVVCTGGVERTCPSDDAWCMVGAERLGAGFRRCIFSTMEGDHAVCPSSDGVADLTFSDRFTFWNVRDDTRRCTPCACTETAPSLCEALVSTFEDEACVDLVAAAAVAEKGGCHDAEPGSALGSLRAEWRVNAPGSCAPSGGELVGDLIVERRTLCCLPEGT
ncbi:hypothetical protein WMF28_03115 [Sorangium sp. So ce590]|uniref:hypothetical protein n=1 Tax=Sorangium sp. So ce590 TaxID=3133317 RepID=UPI003F623B62